MRRISAAAAAAATFAGMISAAPAATAETPVDMAPPTAPSNLRVVHQSANQVQLVWNGPSAAVGRTTYFVSGPPCSPQSVGSGNEATLSSNSVDPNCGMTPGQQYQISVMVQDDTGKNSPYSNTVLVTLAG